MKNKDKIKSLIAVGIVFTAVLSLTSIQSVKAVQWVYYDDVDIDDPLVQGPYYWDEDEQYGQWYWKQQNYEDSSYELPEDIYDEIWVWTYAKSYIYAWTEDYSDLEVSAETEIESSIEMGWYWPGPGQSSGGTGYYYYSFYCGAPYDGAPYDEAPIHEAFANDGSEGPAEVSLEVSSEVLGLPYSCTPCNISSGSSIVVSSYNTEYDPPENYNYYGPYQNPYPFPSSVPIVYDLYWYLNWDWRFDLTNQQVEIDAGETLVFLNLSVSNCTYAYANLDEYQEIHGKNEYYSEAWGNLYFSPD